MLRKPSKPPHGTEQVSLPRSRKTTGRVEVQPLAAKLASFTPTPEEDPDMDFECISEVKDMHDLFRKVERLDGLARSTARTVDSVLGLRKQVDEVSHRMERVDATLDLLHRQVERVESKIELKKHHDCYQVDTLVLLREEHQRVEDRVEQETLQNVRIAQGLEVVREDVTEVTSEVKQIHTLRRQWMMTLVGSLIGLFLTAASAIWFVAQLTSRVDENERLRREQQQRVERDLDKLVQSRHDRALLDQLSALRNLVESQAPESPADEPSSRRRTKGRK